MFEELDYAMTPLGPLVLRRRQSPAHDMAWVYEVTIDGEFLMSSAVKDSELALTKLALERLGDRKLSVLVGGLGLGYTALAALEDQRVQALTVVELLDPVLRWHRERIVPAAEALLEDRRTVFRQADFFELMQSADPLPCGLDAILLDIDHSPQALLHARHASFYESAALRKLAERLVKDGIFALWSADAPDASFLDALGAVFPRVDCQTIRFAVPHMHSEDENFVILAQR